MYKIILISLIAISLQAGEFEGVKGYKETKKGDVKHIITSNFISTTVIIHVLKLSIIKNIELKSKKQALDFVFKNSSNFDDLMDKSELNNKALKLYNKIFKTNFDNQVL